MYKVIIADDERIQREGIAKFGNWAEFEMQVVGLAEDGLKALELINSSGADILITDIKMPNINGLELAEKAKKINPDIKIVIISGYDDFEYAKSAIELRAYAFLLKPVSIDKLNQMLEQISALCRSERQTQEELLSLKKQHEASIPLLIERFLENVLYGFLIDEETIHTRTRMLSIPKAHNGYRLLLMQFDNNTDSDIPDITKQLIYLQVYQFLIDAFIDNPWVFVIRSKENEYALVEYIQDSMTESSNDIIDGLRGSVKLPPNISITICISTLKRDLLQLNEAYKECQTAFRQKFYLGKGKNIFYQDILPIVPVTINYDLLYEQLMQAVEIGNVVKIELLSSEFVQVLSKASRDNDPIQLMKAFCYRTIGDVYRIILEQNEKIESVLTTETHLWERIHYLETLHDVHAWLKHIVVTTASHINLKRSRKNSGIVNNIIQTLEQHYSSSITIEELAKQVYLTPNYISNIFKESIGESIIDYLTKVRMKHAERLLLKDESIKIYEIAEMTGYNSTSYFSVVFKSMYGTSPKEYRDSFFSKNS